MHLSDYMALRKLTDTEIADKLGINRTTIVKLRRRQSDPSMKLARRLQRLTRGAVTLADWPEVRGAE